MFTESKEEDRITSRASQQESSGDNGAIMTKSVQLVFTLLKLFETTMRLLKVLIASIIHTL